MKDFCEQGSFLCIHNIIQTALFFNEWRKYYDQPYELLNKYLSHAESISFGYNALIFNLNSMTAVQLPYTILRVSMKKDVLYSTTVAAFKLCNESIIDKGLNNADLAMRPI